MYHEAVSGRELRIWMGMLYPVAVQLAAKMEWWRSGLTALLSLIIVWCVWKWGRITPWIGLGTALIALAFATQILKDASQVWKGNSYPAVPLLLLVLALWSSWKGAKAAASVGCVLFWVVLIIYPLVCGGAIRDVRWEWTRFGEGISWELCLLLLLPATGKILMKDKAGGTVPIILVVLTALSGLLTSGILGSAQGEGFYEMVRAIDLLGVVKHFEALISAAATLGWFVFLNIILTVSGGAGEMFGKNGRVFAIGGSVVIAVGMLCNVHISTGVLAITGAIFWVLLPVLTQGIEQIKKAKKREKGT